MPATVAGPLLAVSGINTPAIVVLGVFAAGLVVLAVMALRWGLRRDAAVRASRAERPSTPGGPDLGPDLEQPGGLGG